MTIRKLIAATIISASEGLSFDASLLSCALGDSGGSMSMVVDGLGQSIPL